MDRYPYHEYTILLGATRALAHIGVHFTHRVFGLSEILSRKRKIAEEGIVSLTTTYSAVIQNSIPEKMQDLGSFTIPCEIGHVDVGKALCDFGATINLMPLSVEKETKLKGTYSHSHDLINGRHNTGPS